MLKKPLHFAPYLKSVIWGGERIPSYKGIETDQHNIGESWEISAVSGHVSIVDRGEFKGKSLTEMIELFGADLVGDANLKKHGTRFPLLIKFINTAGDLSVQVHPNDNLARLRHNSPGKTEMWNVIETTPGAKIYAGLSEAITPDEYERHVADKTIMDVIASHDSSAVDVYFLPAGRIHSIGAGNLLAEIQQTSDITYRIYDYDRLDKDGNPRQLHTDLAREAIDYQVYSCYKENVKSPLLVDCPNFAVHRLISTSENEPAIIPDTRDSFTIVMCILGNATVRFADGDNLSETAIPQGDTWLFPADMKGLELTGDTTVLTIQS